MHNEHIYTTGPHRRLSTDAGTQHSRTLARATHNVIVADNATRTGHGKTLAGTRRKPQQ